MSDDFFDKLDAKLAEHKAQDVARVEENNKSSTFSAEVMHRIHPVAQDFVSKLKDRGINANLTKYDRSISIELKYGDGGGRTLTLAPDMETNRLEFIEYVRGEGSPYSSTTGERFGAENWDDSKFRKRLEKLIEDHIFYADRHRGLA